MEQPLEILSVDMLSENYFVVYFSDDTVVKMSAQALADCFPHRVTVSEFEEREA
jgi:hypothetical protein